MSKSLTNQLPHPETSFHRQAMQQVVELFKCRLRQGFCPLIVMACIWCVIAIPLPAVAQSSELPELETSASRHLNTVQERRIGQGFYRRLLASPKFVEDYLLQHYIQSIGDRISQHSDLRGVEPVFSLYQDNTVNAYAVPGGYITLYTGLVLAAERESELAAVVAHEIAHLTQRHLPRMLERQSEQKLPTLAALLASLVVGGEVGVAGATAAIGASESSQLAYSREFEREADAIGIRLLADSGFDPMAMPDFFEKLDRSSIHSGRGIPEYLRTHPLSHARMAASQDRAASYPAWEPQESLDFFLAAARIRALLSADQQQPILVFQHEVDSESRTVQTAARYGKAMILYEEGEIEQALEIIRPLSMQFPEHPWIQSLHAQMEFADGQADQAIERYQNVLEANPEALYLNYLLAEAYLENDQPEKALRLIRKQVRRNPYNLTLYQVQKKIHIALDQHAEADQSIVEYLVLLGDYERAISVLKRALRQTREEGYLKQSLEARITELEEKI
ncbi:MAG: M48 family metallopeptidase [Gammaproteobacteria bacterium]|nr:M48 family metallopeptidase [Gammaproteobacteria bacterium]